MVVIETVSRRLQKLKLISYSSAHLMFFSFFESRIDVDWVHWGKHFLVFQILLQADVIALTTVYTPASYAVHSSYGFVAARCDCYCCFVGDSRESLLFCISLFCSACAIRHGLLAISIGVIDTLCSVVLPGHLLCCFVYFSEYIGNFKWHFLLQCLNGCINVFANDWEVVLIGACMTCMTLVLLDYLQIHNYETQSSTRSIYRDELFPAWSLMDTDCTQFSFVRSSTSWLAFLMFFLLKHSLTANFIFVRIFLNHFDTNEFHGLTCR